MTYTQALNRIASMLAEKSFDFSASAARLPNLKDAAQEAMATNRAIAQALNIEDLYNSKLGYWKFPLKDLQP